MKHQSPAVWAVLIFVLSLAGVDLLYEKTTLKISEESIAPGITFVVVFTYLCLIAFNVDNLVIIMIVFLLSILATINWLLAAFYYSQKSNNDNRVVLPTAAACAYFGFLAGELNNDNNFVQQAALRKFKTYSAQHPFEVLQFAGKVAIT